MENDGFLEFKWKGDQFLIFGSCGICIGPFSDFAAALGFFFFFFPLPSPDGRWGQTGESGVEVGETGAISASRKVDNINRESAVFRLQSTSDEVNLNLGSSGPQIVDSANNVNVDPCFLILQIHVMLCYSTYMAPCGLLLISEHTI